MNIVQRIGLSIMTTFLLARVTQVTSFTVSIRSIGTSSSFLVPPSQRLFASVTGTVYSCTPDDSGTVPTTIKLFTKEGCTLCDKVKDVLLELRDQYPHSLEQIDITDEVHADWFSKYKYDIPVLHLNGKFWIKHRITEEEAKIGLMEAEKGTFEKRPGEPDAGAMERRQAQR